MVLESSTQQFQYYKSVGEKTFGQLADDQLFWCPGGEVNSIAVTVNHLWGNMLSRWTDFLTSDGEKDWRERDLEFENVLEGREAMMERWEEGWACLFRALDSLTDADLNKTVQIRGEDHSVASALHRQMMHYAYHIGQIVLLGKMLKGDEWQSLSIPRGQSDQFNRAKFRS